MDHLLVARVYTCEVWARLRPALAQPALVEQSVVAADWGGSQFHVGTLVNLEGKEQSRVQQVCNDAGSAAAKDQ